ncbi:MAG: hypothetical protein LBG09_03050 [Puniceicoccales bacterium]|jgi:hypothetical protein|nr:hypothetical protein [Puniceicoccales bacterium]
MKKSIKKLLPVIAGINGLLCANLWGESAPLLEKDQAVLPPKEDLLVPLPKENLPAPLSQEDKAAVEEMSKTLSSVAVPTEEKVGNAFLDANVRGDAQDPEKFKSPAKIELNQVKFSTERLGTANKWGLIKVNLVANTEDKNIKWTEPCKVKVYAGYENRLPDGKMLLFKSDCTCTTLPIATEKPVFFFIPGDIRLKYNLPDVPDYCALSFTVDGVSQPMVIANKEGRDTYRSDGNTFHLEIKKRSLIESRIMRNFDQMSGFDLPSNVVKNTPSFLTPIDA